jgi:hypothetical protein
MCDGGAFRSTTARYCNAAACSAMLPLPADCVHLICNCWPLLAAWNVNV